MKKLTLCKFVHPDIVNVDKYVYPFQDGDIFVFLGEIKDMKGHGVFVDIKTHLTYSNYHIDNFVELTKDEI